MGVNLMGEHRAAVRWACIVVPFAIAGALGLLREDMASSTAAIVLVLVVVVAGATGDRVAGTLAALSAAAGFDFFLTAPYYSFTINRRDDVEIAIALVLVGLAVTEVALWGLRQQAVAVRRAGYLDGLTRLLDVGSGTDHAEASAVVPSAICTVLQADRVEFVDGPPRPDDAVVEHDGRVLMGGRELDVGRSGLPTQGWSAIPVTRDGEVVGHLRVIAASRVARPSREELRAAVLLAHQRPLRPRDSDARGERS